MTSPDPSSASGECGGSRRTELPAARDYVRPQLVPLLAFRTLVCRPGRRSSGTCPTRNSLLGNLRPAGIERLRAALSPLNTGRAPTWG
jgi:hypothetical protein